MNKLVFADLSSDRVLSRWAQSRGEGNGQRGLQKFTIITRNRSTRITFKTVTHGNAIYTLKWREQVKARKAISNSIASNILFGFDNENHSICVTRLHLIIIMIIVVYNEIKKLKLCLREKYEITRRGENKHIQER